MADVFDKGLISLVFEEIVRVILNVGEGVHYVVAMEHLVFNNQHRKLAETHSVLLVLVCFESDVEGIEATNGYVLLGRG